VRSLDRAVALAMLSAFAAMTAIATSYQYEARLMPLVVGVPAVLLAAVQCVTSFRSTTTSSRERPSGGRGEIAALGWLAVFSALVTVAGVIVGGSLAVVVTQRLWLRETWRTAAIGGAVAAVLLVVVFERQLGIALFEGLLAEHLW
jgi:ABC-type sugar transport system permease subunit